MNPEEFVALANRLEEAYRATETLEKNTEVLARDARAYIRESIVEYFATKEMLLAIVNKTHIQGTHTICCDYGEEPLCYVDIGYDGGICLRFIHNGILKNARQSGYHTTYGDACEKTVYLDCKMSWSNGCRPGYDSDLTDYDWMRGDAKTALKFFDTHVWQADGYIRLRKDAKLLRDRTEDMKKHFAIHAEKVIASVKKTTADLVAM